ncbi:MAG: putative transposase [Bacteriovoracaceae bacterium]|jgi:putative transposase
MPRKNLVRTSEFPYHVTSRCHNQDWFQIPLDEVWELSLDSFKEAHKMIPINLVSYVLMGNHYHMIIKTPDSNLDLFMREFNRRLTLKIQKRGKIINQIFGGRYKWCLISVNNYFINCYRYVYQNPVRAGIVQKCEEYPYSTLKNITQCEEFSIPICDHYGFKDEWGLKWLNETVPDIERKLLVNGLRRSEFCDFS